MNAPSRLALFAPMTLLLASMMLVGCGSDHGDPWINPGQKERLGDEIKLDEHRQQQLRDRAHTGQRQR